MIILSAAGPKIILSHTECLPNEFVLWQEHNQILVSSEDDPGPVKTIDYQPDVEWTHQSSQNVRGVLQTDKDTVGSWEVKAKGDRVELVFTVTNTTEDAWPVAEAFMCYKHRGAVYFWDPELKRTFLEWNGEPVSVRDRVRQMCGPDAFWPKNHLHRVGFEATCDRYDCAGFRNPPEHGWHNHRTATTGGWMAIVSKDGNWVSGTYWEGCEMLAQNGPDYGCIHAGLTLGREIAPDQTVSCRGVIILGRMTLENFLEHYRKDTELWSDKA